MEHQRAAPVIIFLLILAITAIGVISIERGERARDQAQMGRVALAAASALERRASINASYLRAGAALFALQPDIDEPLFERFVAELRLDTDYRGAEGIGWAPVLRVGAGSAIPQEGLPADALDAVPANLRPSLAEQPRAVVVPVTYLLPETIRNRRAVGFDMYSEPVRRAAMDEAERTVRPTASGKVVLVQEGRSGAPGFLIYMPVFEPGPGTRRLRGFISSPYNAGDFLASARELVDLQGMRLVLYDGEPGQANLLGMIAGTGD
ncbi:MAG TPA: CHASE domain-containing protein, partial [Qipengyuania sp.]|nr:CHASE domain-containing protein [Qipengyuania sp.]